MKKIAFFISGFAFAVALFVFYGAKTNDEKSTTTASKEENEKTSSVNGQYIKLVHAPESVAFAGEELPLQYFDVKESLERELNSMAYGHGTTLLTLRLMKRFFPVIEPILAQQNIPDDFKFLCVAESNLQNLVSPAKASGFWQFLASTGRQYGLEINDEVDERYNLEKAGVAACKYFKSAYNKYGNWTVVAAAYNCGMGNIDRAIETQNTRNYYDMSLPMETMRYVYRIVSYKILLSNPEKYGYYLDDTEKFAPLDYTVVSVSSPIASLANFAEQHGTNYKMLKFLNPWLRKASLTNKAGKTYEIKIPAANFRER